MSEKETNYGLPYGPANNVYLTEAAWEVCNQVGGIYTVLRTKVPSMIERWGDNYCLLGPLINKNVSAVFDKQEIKQEDPFYEAVLRMRAEGMEVHYGRWLVSGKPKTILMNPYSVYNKLGEIKYAAWENHGISSPEGDSLFDQVLAFSYMMSTLLRYASERSEIKEKRLKMICHFHEWMAGLPIADIKRENLPLVTVFTTHATMLGRYLAMNNPQFYEHLAFTDWKKEANYFNIGHMVGVERAAAQKCTVFTTVSQVTGKECTHLLGRTPDVIVPNGINIERFTALHEFQNLHREYKEEIHKFIMGHFFQSYSFDLDDTLYFFTSGRYEYRNKGYDLTLEALSRLNWRLKQENISTTVVMFFITKRPFTSISPHVLHSRGVMEEIRQNCRQIEKQVGNRLFYASAVSDGQKFPELESFVDEYWRLRLRRAIQSWKSDMLPSVVTHNLEDDANDDILNFLRSARMYNSAEDRVKIVYHPDFIAPTNPLFGLEYGQFVRGCHLGIFPSYYEPWGYTPLECIASGVPALTSDLSGFGDYVTQTMPDHEKRGMFVVHRKDRDFDVAANQLASYLYNFVRQSRRDRIGQRNRAESSSEYFDWKRLRVHYDKAHSLALKELV